jgi:hypothetical protein
MEPVQEMHGRAKSFASFSCSEKKYFYLEEAYDVQS